MNKEIMLEVQDFDGYYISSYGNAYSTRKSKDKPRILKPQKASQSKKKYRQVRLFNEEYPKGKLFYLHRLVYESFIREIPDDMEIDHKDDNPQNNNVANLQLVTKRANILKHFQKPNVRYLREQRDEMIDYYINHARSYKKVAEKYNCSVSSVYRVIKNIMFRSKYSKEAGAIAIFDKNFDDAFSGKDMRKVKKQWKKK